MSISPAKGMEPIPGYCLVEKLGDGGFGEVWKVTAPGGLFKALKIIYGNLSGPRAEQELKALERIKAVRHPFLLSLERFEVVQDRLLVVTELADRGLFDRFAECRVAGMRGIPRAELLGYIGDAASALDHLSEMHGLQHLDIKPQNLLLVSGRIKVADFGLVKNLLGTSASITGGVTPVYAAPEVFDGRVSRHSDQYSLAIVYQELLTGVRPFPGSTPLQLATQHISAQPFLGALPAQDQAIVARALSKAPEQRFASCGEMVGLLSRQAAAPAAMPEDSPPTVDDFEHEPTVPFPPAPGPPTPTRLNPESAGPVSVSVTALPAGAAGTAAQRPTLFVGLGGAGGTTLRLLRRRLLRRLGSEAALQSFPMLLLDTDRGALRSAQQGEPDEALTPDETLLCPLRPPDSYRDQARSLLRWLDRRWLHGIPRSLRPEGIRPLGRLALLDNFAAVLDRLRQALSQLAGPSGRAFRDEAPRVFVVASLAGGTGGGMLCDVAYAIRQVLGQLSLPDTGVRGLLLYGTSSSSDEQHRARVNAWAALSELSHWGRPDVAFPGAPEQGLAGFGPGRPPFDECYVAHQGERLGEEDVAAATDRVAEYLCLDAVAAGAGLDRLRLNSRRPGGLRTFGLAGVDFARGALIERATRLLCRRLANLCLGDLADSDRESLDQETDRQLDELDLRLEPLLDHMEESLADTLEGEAGQAIASIAGPDPLRSPDDGGPSRLLQEIDGVLGTGGPGGDVESEPGTAERALQESARGVGEGLARSLIDWLLDLVEAPGSRLAAAGYGLGRIIQYLRGEVDRGRARIAKYRFQCLKMRRHLIERTAAKKGSGLRWIGIRRLTPPLSPARIEKLLRSYVTRRKEEIALQGALAVLEAVAAHLAPLQDLKVCRERVGQLADLFAAATAAPETAPTGLTRLMPFGAEGLESAAEALVEHMFPDLIRGLEAQLQAEVLDPRGGLWGVVGIRHDSLAVGPSQSAQAVGFWDLSAPGRAMAAELREQVLALARPAVAGALGGADTAELFLDRHDSPDQARQAVLACAGKARPRLSEARAWDYTVLALPAGPSGQALRDVATQALAGVPLTVVEGYEGVVFIQERAGLSVKAVAAALCGEDPGYAELAARVRTRDDVAWSGTGAGEQRLVV